jgi:glycosyltransferase involved in cell wall biosynthesis
VNILFVLYGGFDTNSAIPLCLHARELTRRGHRCAVAMPAGSDMRAPVDGAPRAWTYEQALEDPESPFDDGIAEVLHAWTPRECVRGFVTQYLARRPTPWVAYLEDNEAWIARTALSAVKIPPERLLEHTEEVISAWTAPGMPHPLRYRSFIALADAAAVIQQKLCRELPPWVPCTAVMPGVDLERFAPRPASPELLARMGVEPGERVVVYPGGLNDFTRPGLVALCRAVQLINRAGVPCRLLRSGPVALDFLEGFPREAAARVTDLGVVPREEMPSLLALADAFVQPGKHDAFEDLRLPGKLPELLAMGRPVVMPETNIAHLLRDGVDAVFHRTGTPEEIAEKCIALFADPERAQRIGAAGRKFAQAHFDPAVQAERLLSVYEQARAAYDADAARHLWKDATSRTPVDLLLARRLRWLAASSTAPEPARGWLESHAELLESAVARAQGLETSIALRDQHIANIEEALRQARGDVQEYGKLAHDAREAVQSMRASASWKLTRPLRAIADIISGLASRRRS